MPVEATELFLPGLSHAGFEIAIHDSLDVYADADTMAAADLIVQCWSMGVLTAPQEAGLVGAVRAGAGFAGWHGGVVATFAASFGYARMVGGTFVHHPAEFLDYDVRIEQPDHPIVEGVGDFSVRTEQYWLLTDGWNEVLASTVVAPSADGEFDQPVSMPVVWTRRWGRGRVFCSAIGHTLTDLAQPEVFTLTSRGLAWASR